MTQRSGGESQPCLASLDRPQGRLCPRDPQQRMFILFGAGMISPLFEMLFPVQVSQGATEKNARWVLPRSPVSRQQAPPGSALASE